MELTTRIPSRASSDWYSGILARVQSIFLIINIVPSLFFGLNVTGTVQRAYEIYEEQRIPLSIVVVIFILFIGVHWMKKISDRVFSYIVWIMVDMMLCVVLIPEYWRVNDCCSTTFASALPYSVIIIVATLLHPVAGVIQAVLSMTTVYLMCHGDRFPKDSLSVAVGKSYYVNIFFLLIGFYVTHRRATYETKIRQIDLTIAEKASQYKSLFIKRLTHELKSPLSVMTSATEYLCKSDSDRKSEYSDRHWHDVQMESCGLLKSLLDNVLVLHRIEAGQQHLAKTVFSIRDCVRETSNMLEVSCNLKEIAFRSNVADSVKPRHIGDSTRIRQIIMNLGSNAVRFTDSGYVQLSIEAQDVYSDSDSGAHTQKQIIRIIVEDTGVGVSTEQQKRILSPDSDSDLSVIPERGGCGLGLSIVSMLVKAYDGRVWIESEHDVGSVFYAEIMLDVYSSPTSTPTTTTSRSRSHSHSQADKDKKKLNNPTAAATTTTTSDIGFDGDVLNADVDVYDDDDEEDDEIDYEQYDDSEFEYDDEHVSRRILLVEDNQHMQALVKLHLEASGHDVTVASNGQEGFDQYMLSIIHPSTDPFDLILMDSIMPVMHGIDCTEAIRRAESDLPDVHRATIVSMTANGMERDLRECAAAGADGFLAKPVSVEKLLLCVATLGKSVGFQLVMTDIEE